MRYKSIQVKSYKSFESTERIELDPKMTVFVGRNNSGKSSLLQTLWLSRAGNYPFRGHINQASPTETEITVEIEISGNEIFQILKQHSRGQQITIPVPRVFEGTPAEFVKYFFELESIVLRVSSFANQAPFGAKMPSHNLCQEGMAESTVMLTIDGSGAYSVTNGFISALSDNIPQFLQHTLLNEIYLMQALRNVSSNFPYQPAKNLDVTGGNLPATLMTMAGDRPRSFERLKEHLQKIVPDITNLTTRPLENNMLEIAVWTEASTPTYGEISTNLAECGLGVGQIIALLYVAMSPTSKVIAIDEPNSFLHPGAAKELINILLQYNNQYIITTHSADIVASALSDKVYLVKKDKGASKVERIDINDVIGARRLLSDLGVSFSDVFGMEQVVWVEGETEQYCFPRILGEFKFSTKSSFVAVRNTGDFQKKSLPIERVIEIYERLSSTNSALPRDVKFSFDSEELTHGQIEDVRRRSRDRIFFLPKRAFENYLIHPLAISRVMRKFMPEDEQSPTEEEIEAWLRSTYSNYASSKYDFENIKSDRLFNAPKMFSQMFSDLSESKIAFKKPQMPSAICNEILACDRNFLIEVFHYITDITGS
ncbi:AAA family ATPase [Methylobacterium sp. NPDC080182]|uniref:AAA family ATPase n=1 Tax=Methylobacterium sp. NPDC080182 TaxID=3390590 RepID=UPI003D05217C